MKKMKILLNSIFLILLFGAINTPFAYLSIEPSSQDYNNLGVAYIKMENWDEAISQFKKALSLDAQNVKVYYHLGKVFFKKKL